MQTRITSERIIIKLLSDKEMEAIIRKESSKELRQAYSEMLSYSRAYPNMREWYAIWDIRLLDNPKISIGNLSFKGLSSDGIVEIGYGIYPEYEGNGYTTEAVKAMVLWATAQPCVRYIEAETELTNTVSQRVLEKAGFISKNEFGEEGPRFVWCGKGLCQ